MDSWEMVDARNKQLGNFYKRLDRTRNRLKLYSPDGEIDGFHLKDPLTGNNMTDVINVTENKSVSYMIRIIAGLMAGKWQPVVESGPGKKFGARAARKIEAFIEANLQQANEYLLSEYGLIDLDSWLCAHVCHTSLLGVQWVASIKDGEYHIHCLPVDMRWTPFVLNKWVAPTSWLDKDELEEELEKMAKRLHEKAEYKKPSVKFKDTGNELIDIWKPETHELWVEKEKVFSEPNPFGEIPFDIIWPPTGFMFRDKDYLEFESPNVLYANEGLYDQLSRQMSVDATLGFNVIDPAYQYATKNPDATKPTQETPKRGQTVEVLEGEEHRPVPTPDINRAELATRDQVNGLIEGAAPTTPKQYNTPPSAIETITEVELVDQLQNPRIMALQRFKESLARRIIRQAIKLGGKGYTVGKSGMLQDFNVSDLKDPKQYTVSYTMLKQSKRLAVANEARALAWWGRLPDEYIITNIMMVDDPHGLLKQIALMKAKALNPAIELSEQAVKYAEEADETEDEGEKQLLIMQWKTLVHEYVVIMRQRLNPAVETQQVTEAGQQKGNPNALTKMLGPGGGMPVVQ